MIRYEQVGVGKMERWSFRALDPKIRGSVGIEMAIMTVILLERVSLIRKLYKRLKEH